MNWPQFSTQHSYSQRGQSLATFLLGVAMALMPFPAWAQVCSLGSPVEASDTNRLFVSDRLHIAFSLPDNYRAMLRRNGNITLHDPATFAFLQCLARTGRYGRIPLPVTVESAPVSNDSLQDLGQLVRHKRPWIDYYNPELTATTFLGQPALAYRYIQDISGIEIANVSFLHADGSVLITVTGPANDPVFQTLLTTFELTTFGAI
ncbi:MAG: hypothetical protein O2890_05440 [Cyanobacteria bacterium]|nr:hypothetical protein [Cyanobacteriota bacterium]